VSDYIIWKSVEDRNVRDVNDVVGLFDGTWEEADALLDKLNAADPSVKGGLYPYWRSEPYRLTPERVQELLENP